MKRLARWLLEKLGYSVSRIPDRHLYHVYDYADMRFILDGREGVSIMDVGANHGNTIESFLRLFPQARVAGVEANPSLFTTLRDKFGDNHRVSLHHFAAAETDAEADLIVNSNDGMSSLLPWKSESEHGKQTVGTVAVRCRPLDMIAEEAGIGEITILKLDIQGAELRALRGCSRLLQHERIKVIHCEVWLSDRDYDGQPNFCDVWQFLAPHGFAVYGLYNTTQYHFTLNRPLNCFDALFVHKSVLESLRPLTHVTLGGRKTTLNHSI